MTRSAGILLAVACASCVAAPQSEENVRYGPARGESLVSIGGNLSDSSFDGAGLNDLKETDFELSLSYGYFVGDHHEIGGEIVYGQVDSNLPDSDVLKVDALAFYNYNIRRWVRTWFYIGVDAGLTYLDMDSLDDSSTEPTYGAHVGARLWATPSAAVFFEPFYRRTMLELSAGDVDQDTLGILFGVEFAF